jgi:hypothetical protein
MLALCRFLIPGIQRLGTQHPLATSTSGISRIMIVYKTVVTLKGLVSGTITLGQLKR